MAKKSKTKTTERCGLAVRRYPPIFLQKNTEKRALYFLVRKPADFVERFHAEKSAQSLYKVGEYFDKKI